MPEDRPDLLVNAAFQEGVRRFNAGQWWEAHEAWETEWRAASGEQRFFLQALILLAAALHKRWRMGNASLRNYHKAEAYLDRLPQVYGSVDLTALRTAVWQALHDPSEQPQIQLRDEPLAKSENPG